MNLFPLQPSFHNSSSHQDFLNNMNNNMRRESERAHMTMIYERKVFVFSDLAAEKTEQILHLAEHNENLPQIYTQLNHQPSPTNSNQLNPSLIIQIFMEDANQRNNFNISMDDGLVWYVGQEPYQNSDVHLAAVSEPQGESKWWLDLGPHQPSQ